MSRVPPSHSNKPPAQNNGPHSSGLNRRQRRAHTRHGIFTRNSVWLNWKDLPLLEEGIQLRVDRLAKRRGKSKTWASKRFNKDKQEYKTHKLERSARMKEILEEMQHGMLHGEHEHETRTPTDES
jgi:hypothetical protein